MPARGRNLKRSPGPRGEDRVLEAIKAGFAGQARTAGKLLTAREFRQGMEDFRQNMERILVQISASLDRLTGVMLEQGRRHEEQGIRMEAMNRRIDENTAAIRENTVALLQIADAIRGSSGDGQPRTGA